jgi:hypothetical protein
VAEDRNTSPSSWQRPRGGTDDAAALPQKGNGLLRYADGAGSLRMLGMVIVFDIFLI